MTARKIIRGSLRYSSNKPERRGEERGREFFTLSQQPDGTDVVLAHCEIDDAPSVVRDVSLALRHEDSAPIDCSVRLTVGGCFEGSGWMRFAEGYAECESYNVRDGRISQRIETPYRVRWLQAARQGLVVKRLVDGLEGRRRQVYRVAPWLADAQLANA